MSQATLGQIHERILVVDELLFKISTGQVSSTIEEQQRLTAEADYLMDALAKGVSEGGQYDYQTAWNERDKVRRQMRLAATMARYSELYPTPDPNTDRIVAKAFADGATPEDHAALAEIYSVVFVQPPPAPPPPKSPKGFFSRLFSRRASSNERQRRNVIDKGAPSGKTISTEAALKHVVALKADYVGPNREEYVSEIDHFIDEFREKHGPQIPANEAYAILRELEARFGRVK